MSFETTRIETTVSEVSPALPKIQERPRRGRLPEPVRFADAAERERVEDDASSARAIVLRPNANRPGQLGSALEADLESALAVRGAVPMMSDQAAADERARILDQLRRAAAVPVRGVCVSLPSLRDLCDHEGVLDAADAQTLRVWSALARSTERPVKVVLLFDTADRHLSILIPESLDRWISPRPVVEAPVAQRPRAEDDGVNLADLLLEHAPSGDDAPHIADDEQVEPVLEARPKLRVADTLRPPSMPAEHLAPIDPPLITRPKALPQEENLEEKSRRVAMLAEWRALALELDAAKGPKPVSAIEKLFVQKYLPLVGATMRGETDGAIKSIADEFSRSFSESYTEAYASLRVTGKRPTMVMDAFDVATKVARLSSARSLRLALIDAMSFDLGERVTERMKLQLDKRAVVVERTILWSALPATTPTQMHLLSRGTDGLRDAGPPSSPEPDIARGRNVSGLRRERVGSRELLKLDLAEARLRSPGPAYDERLDNLADEVAEVLVRYMETLPPRSLFYVFGDHGFVLSPGPNGRPTGPATQGGTSPEEVLVPGYAWLVDAVQ